MNHPFKTHTMPDGSVWTPKYAIVSLAAGLAVALAAVATLEAADNRKWKKYH